jgi:hypothetical protein
VTSTLTAPAAGGDQAESRQGALARGVAALLAGLAVLIVPPLALATIIGWPLPAALPSLADLAQFVTSPISAHALIDILAVIAWLAWAHLTVCLLVEASAAVRGRALPAHVPLGGFNQRFAHTLVTTTALLAAAGAPAAASAAPLTRATATPVAAVSIAADRTAEHPSVEEPVGPASVERTAPASAGPMATCPPPAATNAGVGASHRHAQRPHKIYVVKPPHGRDHDTLWDIADRHLGDPLRYHEIFALNEGRPQPDGRELTKASLIMPGWVLRMPADAVDVTTVTPPATARKHDPPAATRQHDDSGAQLSPHGGTATTAPRAHAPAPPPAAASPPAAAESTEPVQPSAGPGGADQPRHADQHSEANTDDHGVPVMPLGAGLGFGALALLGVLERRRRIAQRRRPTGRRPAPTPTELEPAERRLHQTARRVAPLAGIARLAAALPGKAGDPPVTLRSIRQHDDGKLRLTVDPPTPARPPFTDCEQGWRIAAADLGYTAAATETADPAPTLALLGRDGDAAYYTNLEADGLIGLTGDRAQASRLLAALAGNLAGAPWAQLTRLVVPADLGSQLSSIEGVDAVDDFTGQLPTVIGYARGIADQLRTSGYSCLSAARFDDDSLGPYVVAGLPAEQVSDELAALAGDPLSPLVVISYDAHPKAARWWLHEGRLHLPDSTDVQPALADPAELEQATQLIEQAGTAPAVPANHSHYQAVRSAAPADPSPTGVEVSVLGPVTLTGATPPDRQAVLELIAYLALHRRGVSAEQLGTALWPESPNGPETCRKRIFDARDCLGGDAIRGRQTRVLDQRIGCDWQRFQALAAGDSSEQRQALTLVRGAPFADWTVSEWCSTDGFRAEMTAAIVDLAVSVAGADLDAGDHPAAYDAARAGLRGCRYEERLYRLAIRAAFAEGSTGKARAVMAELKAVLDIDISPDDAIEEATLDQYTDRLAEARRAADTNP